MRLRLMAILFLSCISNALGDDMRQLLDGWYASSHGEVNDEAALSRLKSNIMSGVPNAQNRLNGIYEIVITENDPDKQVNFFSALGFMWHDLAPPSARASFLEARIASADIKQIGMLYGILENDILKTDVREKIMSGAASDWIGVKKEKMFTASGYRTRSGDLSARLAAMLFEMTPASVVSELAASSAMASAVNQVQEVERLRSRLEIAKSPAEDSQTWKDVQDILLRMVEANDSALDAYAARILAWRQTIKPRLQNDIRIIEVLRKRSDVLTLYLLGGRNIQRLANIENDELANFKTAKPGGVVEVQASSVQKGNLSQMDAKPIEPKGTAAPNEEPSASTPWSIIVVLIVAGCGLLWLLLKRRL